MVVKKFQVIIMAIVSVALMANSGGSPGGYTGSKTDGKSCATNGGCHAGKTPLGQEMLSLNIPETGYVPGQTYTLTIEVEKSGISRFGFETTAEDNAGSIVGEFIGNSEVTSKTNRATHKFMSGSGNGSRVWNVEWKAPATGTGDVKIYGAVLATNNRNNTAGDVVIFDTLSISEGKTVNVDAITPKDIVIYPIPANQIINISGGQFNNKYCEIVDLNGISRKVKIVSNTASIEGLSQGIYFLRLIENGTLIIKKFSIL